MKFGLEHEQIPIRHRACDSEVWAGILRTSAKFNVLILEFPRQALGDATLCGKPPRLLLFRTRRSTRPCEVKTCENNCNLEPKVHQFRRTGLPVPLKRIALSLNA